MAYSMFECPKLHNVKSLKFYPETYDHHVSFRHKNLPPDFELTAEDYLMHGPPHDYGLPRDFSVQVQPPSHKKCPIYVHRYRQNEGDFIPKTKKKKNQKAVIEKLEETYWANWKPDKSGLKQCNTPPIIKTSKSPEIQVIKSAPVRRKKIRVHPPRIRPEDDISTDEIEIVSQKVKKNSSRIREIQTESTPKVSEPPALEEIPVPIVEEPEDIKKPEETEDTRFLKHTDSFILNVKKHNEGKEHFEQPKCIRLYKKPGRLSSKNFMKGGSYPLKPCLKKDSSFAKGSNRLARPGSPLIVSSSFSTKSKYGKNRR